MQLRGTQIVVDSVSAKMPVISGSGATRTLNELESGSVVLFDRAAGTVYTLPTGVPGTTFTFLVSKTPTSNAHRIVTNITTSTPVIIGAIDSMLTVDNTEKAWQSLEATANCSIAMNGTTTGGQQGTKIVVTALSAGTWFATGLSVGTGTAATPFTTASA